VALAQIGEFSFIVAALGVQLGVLTADATNTIVAVAIASITLNPVLYGLIRPVTAWYARRRGLSAVAAMDPVPTRLDGQFGAVVVGYGPVGRIVARLLRENEIRPTIIEMNMETVRGLHAEGLQAIYGDASHPDVLAAADVAHARSVALTVAGLSAAPELIRLVREMNPRVQILARGVSLREQEELKRAGAHLVFSGEAEVALAFSEAVLTTLGATAEQIERERARVHAELAQSS
jgi:monovalent cation:H+ antiporter-2, CPA2 family